MFMRVCVCGQERNESLCFVCLCVRESFGGKQSFVYNGKGTGVCVCVCFEWSVGESSKVGGQS